MDIIKNAIVHNTNTDRKVWISLEEEQGGYLTKIADNGPGISEPVKEALFDSDRRYGGVGIHQALRIANKYGDT